MNSTRMKFDSSSNLLDMPPSRISTNKVFAHLQAMMMREAKRQNETCSGFANGLYCDDRPLYRLLMGNVFMLLFFLCVFGNCVNLIIYHSEQMRQFLAIKLLSAKVLLNTLLMVCLLPQALHICQAWSTDSEIERIYWQTWPYQMYLINVLGLCSMWMTVIITFEYYLHVAFPARSKSWCNEANVSKFSLAVALVAIILHFIYPLNRIIRRLHCPGRTFYQVITRPGALSVTLEKAYAWTNLQLAILLPLSLITFMSIYITWRLLFKDSSFQQRHTSEKHCVTRITLVTTALQVICQGPAVPVFIIAAVTGPAMHDELTCFWYTIAHFLGLCNLSLSFYVYLLFSDKFRSLVATKFENCRLKIQIGAISQPLNPSNEDESMPLKMKKKRMRGRARSCVTETTGV